MSARLLLVRHGRSEWNATGRWQGWADAPLNDDGREEARRAAKALHGFDGRVFASDLQRAFETAAILADVLGLDAPVAEPGMREINVGVWTGLTMDEIRERYPTDYANWRAGKGFEREGGETFEVFTARLLAAMERIAAGGDALVVTHAGAIRRLERELGLEAQTLPNLGARWFGVLPLRTLSQRMELATHGSTGEAL